MNPAGKLQMVMELVNLGFLCNCNEIERVDDGEDPNGFPLDREQIKHRDDCQGKEKIKELLNE